MKTYFWYGRVSALVINEENDAGVFEDRYYPQVEMSETDVEGNTIEVDFYILSNEQEELAYFMTELDALTYAIGYRDTKIAESENGK